MLGFCYSIVTQAESRSADVAVGSRSVGTSTLRFLNAVYTPTPTDFDLGDALLGTVITRYLTATGGIRPYNFTSANIGLQLGAQSTLAVFTSGVVMGSASLTTTITDVAFTAKLTDSTESNIQMTTPPAPASNTFHLTLFPSGAQVFRFAVDKLNNGVLGQAYFSKADTIGGIRTVTYSVVPGSVTLNGVQVGTGNSLEEAVGLTLAADGTVYGRPLSTGLVTFTAHATDSRRRIANDRTNAVQDQVLSFNIEDSQITATDNMFLALNVRGNTGLFNTDTLKFQTFLNMSGTNLHTLNGGQFSFMFGGKTYGGFINAAGVVGNGLGRKNVIYPDGTVMTAMVNSVNGTIIGTLTRANLSTGLNAANLQNRTTARIPAAILVNNIVIASDTLDMQVTHLTTKYSLDYNVGTLGNSLGGAFQVFDVRGSDKVDIAGNPGDSWITKFLIAPRYGVDATAGYSSLNAIRVRIGTNFIQTIPVATPLTAGLTISSKGIIVYKGAGKGASVHSMQINPASFSGEIITNPLSEATTGLPTGTDTEFAKTNFFNLAVDVLRNVGSASYSGEDGKFIFKVPAVKAWLDRDTKKPGLSGF